MFVSWLAMATLNSNDSLGVLPRSAVPTVPFWEMEDSGCRKVSSTAT